MIETIVLEYLNQALDGEAQIGIANANLVYQAQQGTDSFEGYANENLRIFAGLYYNPNQVVVTRDSGIETLEDLVGMTCIILTVVLLSLPKK